MAAAYASLVSLMRLIHDLQHHPSPPISLDKQLLDSIAQRVEYFQEFLHSYNSNSVTDDDEDEAAADPLELRIAAAANAAEDAIESHIVDRVNQKRGVKNSINQCRDRLQKKWNTKTEYVNNSYASLVSLMQLIHDLDRPPSPPISLGKHLLYSITQHVAYFQEFLESYNPPNEEEEDYDPWEMRIAASANAAENAIESYIVDCVDQKNWNRKTNDEKIKSIDRYWGSLLTEIKEMESIKKVVVDQVDMTSVLASVAHNKTTLGSDDVHVCDSLQRVIEEMDSIKKVVVGLEKQKELVVHDQVTMRNVLPPVARNETMVGSDDALLEIMEKLVGGQLDFLVIPIGGMG